jgi:hemerythrin
MSVGIARFDEDHKRLIRYVNELGDAIQDGKSKGAIDPVEIEVILHRMENYARAHFLAEEKVMEITGYPGLEEHRAEHRKFIATVAEISGRCLGSSQQKCANEIAQFLYDWIINHVYQVDGLYVEHLRKNGVE